MINGKVGDLFLDEKGKLWRVIATLAEPSLTMEEVEPEAQPNPAYLGIINQQMGQAQTPTTLPLPRRRKIDAGVSGGIWIGFKKIYSAET